MIKMLWLNILMWIGIIFLIFMVFIFGILRLIRHFYKFPIPAFATRLIDNPIRRKIVQPPEVLVKRMQLNPGMKVLEIGPGKGSYTKAVAENIEPDGIVYATDIQDSVINSLKKRIEKWNIKNIIPKVDEAYNLSFKNETFDRIFAIACLPEIPEPIKALKEFKRVLKSDGLVCLSELFPDPDYPLRRTEIKWAKEAGLELSEKFGNWFVYQLNFRKK
ncbi:MAG: methyltransferase domain-containing protein [Candidatus Lokiarchaeota archaeon]|nr:methyltransferase domain-containing protein [Candidatus Lokiarchaeota archaeon]